MSLGVGCSLDMTNSGESVSQEALLKQIVQRNGMITDKIFNRSVKRVEDIFIRGNESRFVAVASGEVLRGDNRNGVTSLRVHQKDFGMVVCKVSAFHHL